MCSAASAQWFSLAVNQHQVVNCHAITSDDGATVLSRCKLEAFIIAHDKD